MVNSPASYTQDTNVNTDHEELTQDSHPPGPGRQPQHVDDDRDFDVSNAGKINKSESEEPPIPNATIPSSSKQTAKADEIKIHCSNNTVTWRDEDGEHQTDHLDLEINIDTTANTAFLRLYGDVFIKSSKPPNRRAIYVYIRPEIIKSITYQNENNVRSLCFSLALESDLVTPKEPIVAKPKSKALLNSIVALSQVTSFTVRLNSSSTTPSAQLKKIASIFSPRPSWNAALGDLSGLYTGKGGQIVNASTAAASTHAQAESPPPYVPASSNERVFKKRKLDIPQADEHGSSANNSDMPPINSILNDMEKRIMNSIRQLGEKLLDVDASSNHCRYGTEEREELLEEVATRVDDELTDLRIQSTDVIEDVKDEVDRMLNQVDDDAKERIELLESELEGRMKHIAEEAAEKYVKDTLLNASWRMDGTMSLQRQM
ncbi:hypothetical protein A0O28_0047870 [Trichoderma guizhouense]|uniref:Uncharacterized protein n=1 Tax=Trichoderma guizhouense TaxID=1491466 RepID=A0A1T3CDF9_9HYPO|nr:hypothetical protein A0O28_0047870 [Trichoderma guizhouense]